MSFSAEDLGCLVSRFLRLDLILALRALFFENLYTLGRVRFGAATRCSASEPQITLIKKMDNLRPV